MENEKEKNNIENINYKNQNINKINSNDVFGNKIGNIPHLYLRKRIQNSKFIEEIFKYSEELNELIPIFKENSNQNIKDFFYFLIQIINNEKKENLNEDEVKLICYNLRELKVIFLKSSEIIDKIQFNKEYYNEEYKENGIIGILFNLYINTSNNEIKIILEGIFYIIKSKNNLSKIIIIIILIIF